MLLAIRRREAERQAAEREAEREEEEAEHPPAPPRPRRPRTHHLPGCAVHLGCANCREPEKQVVVIGVSWKELVRKHTTPLEGRYR